MSIVILLFTLFIFLYVLHYYVRDDFIIFRKNVTLDDVFNIAFLSFVFVFLGSRFFYVADNFNPIFFNPLVFLAFPYYPGFSLTGGILVGALFLLWHVHRRKFPGKRIFDFFSIATLWSVVTYSLISTVIFREFSPGVIIENVFLIIMLGLFLKPFIPKYLSGKIKDGFLTGIFLMAYSVAKFTGLIIGTDIRNEFIEVSLLLIMFFSGLIFVLKEELAPKVRDLK